MHGGKSLSGPAAPNFRHGRYSRSIAGLVPARLRGRFEEALADPELLSLRSHTALIDVRVSDLVDRLGTSDAGSFRQQLLELWGTFKRLNAVKSMDRDKRTAQITAVFGEIDDLLNRGGAEQDVWSELSAAIKERAALAGQEHRRLLDLHQVITPAQAMAIVIALHGAVVKFVTDKTVLSQIGSELTRLVNGPVSDVQNP
jgi:hypothetical protein